MVSTALFATVLLVAYGALQSMRSFAQTNATQVELQEEARFGIERMMGRLQWAGRFTEAAVPLDRAYPKIFKSGDPYPEGYSNANQHPPKNVPKACPGSNANGNDPTLDSDEVIYKTPKFAADGMPVMDDGKIVWTDEEYGFFIVPQTDGSNSIEFRNSTDSQQQVAAGQTVQGQIIARFVDRMQIHDYSTDPTLTQRQLRVTLYLTRCPDPTRPDAVISVVLSSVIDMRNTSQLE
jgi:hypothetical protein